MNYTQSDAFATHSGTGFRMHQDTLPITTEVAAADMNMLVWSLMEFITEAGLSGLAFDANTPATYRKLYDSIIGRLTGTGTGQGVDLILAMPAATYASGTLGAWLKALDITVEALNAAQGSGVLGYTTKAAMDADLAHAVGAIAYVTNDSTSANNGIWSKSGASGSGSWAKSLYDPVTQLSAEIYRAALKISTPINTSGEAFNGAVFFNGVTSVGTTGATGGWKIPAGQTGRTTYNRYRWAFTTTQSAVLANRKVRFVVVLTCSSNLLTTLAAFAHSNFSTGASGTFSNWTAFQETANRMVVQFDYVFVGTETLIETFLQVNGSQTALGADAWLVTKSQYWSAVDTAGSNEAFDASIAGLNASVAALSQSVSKSYLSSAELLREITPESIVFNGATATFTVDQMGLTVPALSSGINSYMIYKMALGALSVANPGATVRMRLVFTTSADFKAKYTSLNVNVNGNYGTNQGVAGSVTTTQVNATTLVAEGNYILKGHADELMGLYLQLNASALDTAAVRSFYLTSATYSIIDSAQPARSGNDLMLNGRLHDFGVASGISSGDLKLVAGSSGQQFNGGEVYDSGWGIRVPAGQTGSSSYRRYQFDAVQIKKYVGTQMKFALTLETSTNFTEQTAIGNTYLSVYFDNAVPILNAALLTKTITATSIVLTGAWTITGHETSFGPYVQVTGAGVRTTDGTWTLTDMRFTFTASGDPDESVLEQMSDYRARVAAAQSAPTDVNYVQTLVVKQDGSGDYTTMASACAAAVGVSALQRALIKVYPGIYTETNYNIPVFCDVLGIGERDRIWLKGDLADSVAVTTIPTVQTIWMQYTSKLKNLKITARNMRYPIHSDSGASTNRALQEIEDCYVEHIGNEGARAYQTSIGANPAAVWGSEHAWGCGTHSGQRIYSRRTHWVSRTSPFYFHTSLDFAEPCYVEVDQSHVICSTDTGDAFSIQPLGSGQPDRLVIKDSVVRGKMSIVDTPWLSLKAENQRANRMEIEVSVSGSGPIAWTSTNGASTLELRSIDGSSSSVAVSGTGAIALFGAQPDVRPGSVGYAGRVYGAQSIVDGTNFFQTSMGIRLGDCTTTAKTLGITFDGSINVTLTLAQNYTAMSNATVLGLLNTALADGAGRAFYISDPWENRATVHQFDFDHRVKNTGTTAILRGTAAAMNGSQHNARPMTSADAAKLFSGVAMDDIPVGQFGRVQRGGQVMHTHLVFDGTPSIAFGDEFSVSAAAPGAFVESAATPLLRCIEVRSTLCVMEVLA